jgi:hypothetical protein
MALVKETADGLGRLVADHIKLARTELVADAKSYGRDVAVFAAAVFVLALGYGLACVAGALALGRVIGGPLAFAAVAGLHLLLGAGGAFAAVRALRGTRPMAGTLNEVSLSVTALAAPVPALRAPEVDGAPPARELQARGRSA